jgi:hypothetical protein
LAFGSTYHPAGSVTRLGPESFPSLSKAYTRALTGSASITGSPLGTRITFVWQPRQIGNASSQIRFERLWCISIIHSR